MELPSSCSGCPFYQYKNHPDNAFVPDMIVPGSEVMFIGQNPGRHEAEGKELVRRVYKGKGAYSDEYREVEPQPLIGKTGQDFNKKFLTEAGLKRGDVSVGNAIRCRPGKALGLKADDLPTITSTMRLEKSKADIVNALKHCKATHLKVPTSVHTVVTMGRHAMFQMTGLAKDEDEFKKKQGVMESWRGYAVQVESFDRIGTVDTSFYHPLDRGKRIFFTMHIAALNYGDNKKYTHATYQDFNKLGRLLRKEWPLPLPQWSTTAPQEWPNYASFDTEYNPDSHELYRWSMCDATYNLYCVESDGGVNNTIPIRKGSTVLIQNALADIAHLSHLVDMSHVKVEDLMLAHSVLWPGEPHSLNYMNSIYGALNRYKHLSGSEEPVYSEMDVSLSETLTEATQIQLYSAMDAFEPMQMWKGYFIPEFKRDRLSWQVYQRYRLPLIPIIDKAQQSGALLDSSRLDDVKLILMERLEQYRKRAQELTGDSNFKLGGSKGMREQLYG